MTNTYICRQIKPPKPLNLNSRAVGFVAFSFITFDSALTNKMFCVILGRCSNFRTPN
jgi:hypothetical protein